MVVIASKRKGHPAIAGWPVVRVEIGELSVQPVRHVIEFIADVSDVLNYIGVAMMILCWPLALFAPKYTTMTAVNSPLKVFLHIMWHPLL